MNPERSNLREQEESGKSEKEIAWKNERAKTDEIKDRLDLGVDEAIKEAVTAFRIHGFTTSQSCEGHKHEGINEEKDDHGTSFPWIEIYAPEPEGWKESEEKKKEWAKTNLEQQRKMMTYLEEFYRDRKVLFDARLTFDPIGVFGGFRVQSFGARIIELLPREEQLEKLELYRKEINDFAEFLKEKYFAEK
jgi:hypothetical protein